MRSRSVSVTGATGFLGWHIAEALLNRGWRVRAIVRPDRTKALPEGVERRGAALEDTAALATAFAGTDLVVHAAALTRWPDERVLNAVNIEGTRAVVAAANQVGARLILISSQAAIGPGTLERPSREDDSPRPLTPYGRSKLASEAVVRSEAQVPWTILRPSAIYGPRDRLFLPLVRLAARGWFPVAARPSASFTLVYADDAARAVAMAAEDQRSVAKTFFIGHPDPQTTWSILQLLARAVGREFRPRRVPAAALQALAIVGELGWRVGVTPMFDRARLAELWADGFVCAVDHARDAIEFTADTPLGEGLDRTVRWYRDRGWI